MHTGPCKIAARSKRQAMDWALVLASQGIEAIIDHAEDGPGWQLIVPDSVYDNAQGILRQYQAENRGWPFRQPIIGTGLLFDWTSVAWVALLGLFFWLDSRFDLRNGGVMDSALLWRGQWWRLFTAMWLHADVSHLASNAALGFVLLGLVMARYGAMVGLLAACLTGVGGNFLAALAAPDPYRSLGASGVVMGCVGLLALPLLPPQVKRSAQPNRGAEPPPNSAADQSTYQARRAPLAWRYIFSALAAGCMLFILVALGPGTDILAHLGGFVCGLVLGAFLWCLPASERKPILNFAAGVVFALLVVILPWWLALRS